MKIGTWNLQQASPKGLKGQAQAAFLAGQQADLSMLTEVHEAFVLPDHEAVVLSPGHLPNKPRLRWAGISSRWSLSDCGPRHQGLALGRAETPSGSLPVASSVMPWRGARTSWPGDPDASHAVRFADTLNRHRDEIQQARQADEPVVWGGDFNQALSGQEVAGSMAGRQLLLEAFASGRLSCATSELGHLSQGYYSIDHIAVPAAWAVDDLARHVSLGSEGKLLSDHACYSGHVHLPVQR